MEIRARQKGRVVILDLSGHIDVDSANLVEAVGQCLRDGYFDILCNFAEVDFIDYMGISAIVIAYKEVINNKGRMKFVNVPVHLKGMLSIAGLDRTIDIYATEDLAINSFKEDKIIENIQKLQLRRRFKRLPLDIKTEIRSKYNKSITCVQGEMLNLSAIGAYIFGCEKFKLGDELLIKIKLSQRMEVLELEAKVVWLPDKQVQPHAYPGIGIEFCNIAISVQRKLLEFIEKNLSHIASED